MLFARHHTGKIVKADNAHRNQEHRCPVEYCACPVDLRAGEKRADHFGHRHARPACPLYVAEGKGGQWNGRDASAARQLVLLDNQVLLLGRDTTFRLAARVDPTSMNLRLTPYHELLTFRATANERMLFLAHRLGTRVWSKEAVHAGDRCIAVTRPHDPVPDSGEELVLAEHREGWRARSFVMPTEPSSKLLGWLRYTGVHFRPARTRAREESVRACTDGLVHFARLGTAPLSSLDVDVSGRDVQVDVTATDVGVTCPHPEPVQLIFASALVVPFIHLTRHGQDGGRTVSMKLKAHQTDLLPGSVDATYNVHVRFPAS